MTKSKTKLWKACWEIIKEYKARNKGKSKSVLEFVYSDGERLMATDGISALVYPECIDAGFYDNRKRKLEFGEAKFPNIDKIWPKHNASFTLKGHVITSVLKSLNEYLEFIQENRAKITLKNSERVLFRITRTSENTQYLTLVFHEPVMLYNYNDAEFYDGFKSRTNCARANHAKKGHILKDYEISTTISQVTGKTVICRPVFDKRTYSGIEAWFGNIDIMFGASRLSCILGAFDGSVEMQYDSSCNTKPIVFKNDLASALLMPMRQQEKAIEEYKKANYFKL